MTPSEIDKQAKAAAELEQTKPAEAEAVYARILEQKPDYVAARLGMAWLQLAAGKLDEIDQLLDLIPPGGDDGLEADRIRSERDLRRQPATATNEEELRAQDCCRPGKRHAASGNGSPAGGEEKSDFPRPSPRSSPPPSAMHGAGPRSRERDDGADLSCHRLAFGLVGGIPRQIATHAVLSKSQSERPFWEPADESPSSCLKGVPANHAVGSGSGHFAAWPGRSTFTVSPETTHVTGPLDKNGGVDYMTALNERLGKDITPETNGNVLLWKALACEAGPACRRSSSSGWATSRPNRATTRAERHTRKKQAAARNAGRVSS